MISSYSDDIKFRSVTISTWSHLLLHQLPISSSLSLDSPPLP